MFMMSPLDRAEVWLLYLLIPRMFKRKLYQAEKKNKPNNVVKHLSGQITFKELVPPMNWKDKRGGVLWISRALGTEADHHYSHDMKQRQMGEKGPASPSSCPSSPISVFHGVKPCKYQWTKGPRRYCLQDSAVWQRNRRKWGRYKD